MKKLLASMCLTLAASACGTDVNVSDELGQDSSAVADLDVHPTGKGAGVFTKFQKPDGDGKPSGGGGGNNGITYHGGPVMLGTVNAYYIWYGEWTNNSATTILTDFISNLGGSPYSNINTTYYNGLNQKVSGLIAYGGSTNDAYSRGTALSDTDVATVVKSAITNGFLPVDANGVYFVLTSADVTATSGFCTKYCGWHTHSTTIVAGTDVKFSFVGNADRCPSACAQQTTTSPNDNVGADAMASIVAHEVMEAISDPDLNAWYDQRGAENADKCAWTFGATYTAANGSFANVSLGGHDYLIQRNWLNANGGSCVMSY